MNVEIRPDAGERVLLDVFYHPPKTRPFRFVVSDRYLYMPMRRRFVLFGDSHYVWRVPVDQVAEVGLKPVAPYGMYLLSFLMLALGGGFLWALLQRAGGEPDVWVWGGAGALAFIGALLPLTGLNRKRLVVTVPNSKEQQMAWLPPSLVDIRSRRHLKHTLDDILRTCAHVGIPVDGVD